MNEILKETLAALAKREIADYEDAEIRVFYVLSAAPTPEEEAEAALDAVDAQLFRAQVYFDIRRIALQLPADDPRLAALHQAAVNGFGFRQLYELLTGDGERRESYEIAAALRDMAEQWQTVEEVAAGKGCSEEVLRRLLRDDRRRAIYFPSARPPRDHWLLASREVARWAPAGVGRPTRER